MHSPLRTQAAAWIAADPDPETRMAGQALLDAEDDAGLRACFGKRLQFGTAGMRGALGPGPNRMNRALVRRVTAGLGAYLSSTIDGAYERGVVIGFDARHGSRPFSEDAAAVLAAAGFKVWIYDEIVPTPELARAVLSLGCAAGIMVTASHNPPQDNGYKVYWADGAQIIPPHDTGISAAIDAVAEVTIGELPALRAAGQVCAVPPALQADYLTEVAALRVWDGPTDLRVVYTAMHGVGRERIEQVFAAAGYPALHLVAEQVDPDPDFPTVAFPNPEEPGALDLALALASSVGADLLVANDPDADRLAVAVPDGAGGYTALTGDQVGALLADELLRHGPQDARRLVATTVVSSTLLRRIAAAHGAAYVETLTGFKWIANKAIDWDAEGGRFVMGYEEALGYSCGAVARDKDGVSAALLFADLAARCKADGVTVLDRLEQIYRAHGVHLSSQKALKLPGDDGALRIQQIMTKLRGGLPERLLGEPVLGHRDLREGVATDLRTGNTSAIELPRSDVLAIDLEAARVLVRPSGTEPKIKFYFEVRAEVVGSLDAAQIQCREALARLEAEVLALAGI